MVTAQKHILIPESRPYRWTREQYYRMGEIGLFEDKRVELIEGEVMEMSPIYSPHATSVTLAREVLLEIFAKGWLVREEKPLSLGNDSEVEPDIALVEGKARDFKDSHPEKAALLIEVADSSLSYDRNQKASLYAKAGIQDYWILNLQDRQIEVHRRPIDDDKAKFGSSYGDKMIFKEGDSIAPLVKPDVSIAVADLLP